MNVVSKNIKRLRMLNNMTQDQLAERMSVTRQAVSNWETERTQPDIDTLNSLAEVFNTDINEIIYGVPKGAYPRFQERFVRMTVICLLVALCFFFIHEWAPLYLKNLASDIYWTGREKITLLDYMGIPLLCEALCSFALGSLIMSVASLFYDTNIRIGSRKVKAILITVLLLIPMFLVLLEVIVAHVSKSSGGKFIYIICIKHTWLKLPLLWLCPFIAGILFFLFINRRRILNSYI